MALRIEDYALIGDCETAALVGRNGSIDWLCWPRFDSEACFAALLGGPEHGCWCIAPAAASPRIRRAYRDGTLILETTFETAEGEVALIDFMPFRGATSDLVRLVVGRRGAVRMRMELVIRFDYGRLVPWVSRMDDGRLRAVVGPHALALRTDVPHHGENLKTVADFVVHAGERASFVLAHSASHASVADCSDADAALAETERLWIEWSDRCSSTGPWREAVVRSLITIKALTYRPTGGLVAAPTTSLPEEPGGSRNWDYRLCWLRDATYALSALMNAGYRDEAQAWGDWLLRAVAGNASQVQPVYGVAGEYRCDERILPWLPGHLGSTPVRTGNAAYSQCQLDIFGEVMDALHQARMVDVHLAEPGWSLQRKLVEHLESIWRGPDEGIWEIRGEHRHFVHSKVMAWVALDRAIRAIENLGLEGPADRWRRLRTEIHAEVCTRGFDPGRGTFVQAYDHSDLDAAALLFPRFGFLPADDPRMLGTVRALQENLMIDGLMLRYDTNRTDDGLPPGEGAFLACSFWLADALALQGRREEARHLFERLLRLRNDVGLLAEQCDPRTGAALGNFPQAFSHLALVDTARILESPAGAEPSEARPVPPAGRAQDAMPTRNEQQHNRKSTS